MNCETARERLLEADLTAFQGEGELARHLETCEGCRKQAQAILDQYAVLRRALERPTPRLDPVDPRWQRLAPKGREWRPGWPVLLPLALAAALAIMVVTRRQPPRPEPNPPLPGRALTAAGLDVQGAPGQAVAVFQTDNPNIVVIWSF